VSARKRVGWEISVDIFTDAESDEIISVIDDALHEAHLCGCPPWAGGGYVISGKPILDEEPAE
jgi:hypothetical protein